MSEFFIRYVSVNCPNILKFLIVIKDIRFVIVKNILSYISDTFKFTQIYRLLKLSWQIICKYLHEFYNFIKTAEKYVEVVI